MYPAEHVHQVVEGVRLCVRIQPRAVVPLARVLGLRIEASRIADSWVP